MNRTRHNCVTCEMLAAEIMERAFGKPRVFTACWRDEEDGYPRVIKVIAPTLEQARSIVEGMLGRTNVIVS